jgi:D-glycero-D-manno-heptose 1,7-bisphosphate phosphatase
MTRRAAFLDRDGVLVEPLVRNNRAIAPFSLDEFRLVPDAGLQVTRLARAGLLPIVVTNQPEVARGIIAPVVLEEMHERLRRAVPVEDIFVCAHDGPDGCGCRKPKPGMLVAAAEKWGIDLAHSFMVGDRGSDVEAGQAAGCYTVLIERPYSGAAAPSARVSDLATAVDAVLARLKE